MPMKYFWLVLGLFVLRSVAVQPLQAQTATYSGPVPRITSGFGADGAFQVETQTFPSPLFRGQVVTVYLPRGAEGRVPVIFFAHGFGAISPANYAELLRHIATRGYAVVYSPYQALEAGAGFDERYNTLWAGFQAAVQTFASRMDTSRVGFMGHSYGAGAIPAMAWRAFVERSWGQNGRLLFPMAPWYSDQITNEQLRRFPSDVKLLMQVYNDDVVNDHQMAVELFYRMPVPNTEKDYVNILADTVQTAAGQYIYEAGHSVCATANSTVGGVTRGFDAYDIYGVFRLFDALAEYTFTGSAAAKNVALGNGSPEQVFMGVVNGRPIRPLVVSDTPVANPTQRALWTCGNAVNPRRASCAVVTSVRSEERSANALVLVPNPAHSLLRIEHLQERAELVMTDMLGREVLRSSIEPSASIDVAHIANGVYYLRVYGAGGRELGRTQVLHILR
jgi:hypothetical protein